MPRQRTHGKGFACDPADCFDSRHLHGSLYKVYSVMKGFAVAGRTATYGKDKDSTPRPLLFTASIKPRLCNAVCMSKNQTYSIVSRLDRLGWIVIVRKGKRKRDGSLTPDTWRVVEHEEYAETHPGLCPPYEYAQDFEMAQAHGVTYGQRLRESGPVPENLYGDLNTPLGKAIYEVMSTLTEEQKAEVLQRWKTVTPVEVKLRLPVPNSRARQESDQSLKLGTGPVPNDGECQSLSSVHAGPYYQDAPVPIISTDQSLKLGKNLSTSPVTLPITTTITTTNMAATAARPWLSWLWLSADEQRRDYERYRALKLRRAILADDNSARVSPDILAIEELIRQHGENFLILAWACFASNPAPHCQPPYKDGGVVNEDATKYPVTVFLEHFDSYLSDGKAEYERFKAEKASGGERYSEVIWHIRKFNQAHTKQK